MKTYQELIEDLHNAEGKKLDTVTKMAVEFLKKATNEQEKEAVRVAIKEKVNAIIASSKQLIKETDEIIAESEAERLVTIEVGGQKYNSKEWLTYSAYVKAFNLNSTTVVTNWIKRGIVPPSNLLILKELNLKLIKATPYMA